MAAFAHSSVIVNCDGDGDIVKISKDSLDLSNIFVMRFTYLTLGKYHPHCDPSVWCKRLSFAIQIQLVIHSVFFLKQGATNKESGYYWEARANFCRSVFCLVRYLGP